MSFRNSIDLLISAVVGFILGLVTFYLCFSPEDEPIVDNRTDHVIDSLLYQFSVEKENYIDSVDSIRNIVDTIYVEINNRKTQMDEEIKTLPSISSDKLDTLMFKGTRYQML